MSREMVVMECCSDPEVLEVLREGRLKRLGAAVANTRRK